MAKKKKEKINKALGAFLVALLVLGGQGPLVSAADAEDYKIVSGSDMGLIIPTSLKAGEIWTGKEVVHNIGDDGKPDGTITVTLYAYGSEFTDESGIQAPLGGDGCVTVIDDLGDFRVMDGFPAGVNQVGNDIVWKVDQALILGPTPATVIYTLELKGDSNDWITNYWYATGTAVASFVPAQGNPFYWTKEETIDNAFTMSMNWNNGKGLNSGTITDNVIDVTISFGKNSSPEFENAYTGVNGNYAPHWDTNAVTKDKTYDWHLEWDKTNDVKSYYFTVGGLGELQLQTSSAPVDIIYEVIFPNPGGNFSQPGARTLKSDEFFHRTFEEGKQDKRFTWDGDAIVVPMDVFGEIKLDDGLSHTGSLTVKKALMGWYHIDWGVDNSTIFKAMIRDDSGHFLAFDANGGGSYTFTGITATAAAEGILSFSVNTPATITNIPAGLACSVVEIFDTPSDLITTSYSGVNTTVIDGENVDVTVTNDYAHGLGKLEIWKLYDGFPLDWGVDDSTEFHVRIWDVDYHNYLLFKTFPETDGAYRCIGNDDNGLSESYYGPTTRELSIKTGTHVVLSNLWTWGRYEVQEFDQKSGVWTKVRVLELDGDGRIPDGNPWLTDDDWVWAVTYSANNGTNPLTFNETQVVTLTNRYKHGVGNIAIYKELAGSPEDWGIDGDSVFYAKIADIADPRYPNYLWFKSEPESDDTYRCVGNDYFGLSEAYGGTVMTEVPFSVNEPIVLSNLWAEDSRYQVVEILSSGEYVPDIDYSFNDFVVPINDTQIVTVTNTFESGYKPEDGTPGTGNLVVRKLLDAAGFHADFGVDRNTEFQVKIWDFAHNNYLIFNPAPMANGSYRCVGHLDCGDSSCGNIDVDGVHYSETPGADYITSIPFSVNRAAVLSNLWTLGHDYRIEEIVNEAYADHCAITYSRPGGTVGDAETLTITVTNTFKHGAGDLAIYKDLADSPGSWNITGATVFKAKVWDVTAGNYLLFKNTPEADGSYRCVGNQADGLSEAYTGATMTDVPFSKNKFVMLSNLWPGREYRVEEADARNGAPSYAINTGLLNNAGQLSITVTNTYTNNRTKPVTGGNDDDESDNNTGGGGNGDGGNGGGNGDGGNGGGNGSGGGDGNGGGDGDGNGGGDGNGDGGNGGGDNGDGGNGPPSTPVSAAPGGSNRDVPPSPSSPVYRIAADTDGGYIELDDQGIPHGKWIWDEGSGGWIFNELPPLSDLPKTGNPGVPACLPLLLGASAPCLGLALRLAGRKRGKHEYQSGARLNISKG